MKRSDSESRLGLNDPDASLRAEDPGLASLLDSSSEVPRASLDAMHRDLAHSLARESGPRAWLSSRPTWLRGLCVGLAGLVVILWQFFFSLRADFNAYPGSALWLALFSFGTAFVLALTVVLWPVQRPALPEWLAPAALALSLALPIACCFSKVHTGHPASLVGEGENFLRLAANCFAYGLVMAAPALALLYVLDRRSNPRRWSLPMVASIGGLTANSALFIHCSSTRPVHLFFGHASVSIALALAYALVAAVAFSACRQ